MDSHRTRGETGIEAAVPPLDMAGGRARPKEHRRVGGSIVFVGQRLVAMPTKAASGRRQVSLDAAARDVLLMAEPTSSSAGVFRAKSGRPPTTSNIRKTSLHLCEEGGVPLLSPHGLRHVAAMLALRATRDIYLVQRRLGHTNVTVTLGIYGYSPDDEGNVADALNGLLASKPVSSEPHEVTMSPEAAA
jgi:integrase